MTEVILIKFMIVFLMSLIFGIERQMSNKPIGFGTFIFVAVGSCSLGVLASIISPENMLGIIGGVVTGVGFLGAGALIKTTDKIFGFTTAASIWIFSIIGLTVGIGQYIIGGITYSLVWTVILIDKTLEKKGIGSYQRKVTIQTKKLVDKEKVIEIFGKNKWRLLNFEENRKTKTSSLTYLVNMPRDYVNILRQKIEARTWIEFFRIE